MRENILKALKWRYAVKVFDPTKKITQEQLHTILEAGRLAPSSLGTEPWKFIVVENPELRAKMREASYGQPKVTDAAYIIVVARRIDARQNIAQELIERTAKTHNVQHSDLDGLRQMVDGGMARQTEEQVDAWVKGQTYIPLGIMIETAALLGIDAGPMEGFNPVEVDKILGLKEKNLASTSMLALGHRGDDPAANRPKVRRHFDEVVEFIK